VKQLALTQFPWPELAMVPLVLFFIFFVGVLVWINLRSNREKFLSMSRLPLEGEEHE
jgi:cbb3-type cytochrome oxidase subunit 3